MANRENPVQTANSLESYLGLHCLSRPFWQVTENGEQGKPCSDCKFFRVLSGSALLV